MDDPWGSSPWATDMQSPRSLETEERPVTPVEAYDAAPRSMQLTSSPWDDEQDNGEEWRAMPKPSTRKDTSFDETSNGWATSNTADGNVVDILEAEVAAVVDVFRSQSPLSISAPVHSAFLGTAADDTWADEPPTTNITLPSDLVNCDDVGKDGSQTRIPGGGPLLTDIASIPFNSNAEESTNTACTSWDQSPHEATSITTRISIKSSDNSANKEVLQSRPSSSLSEHSQVDEHVQESARTSIDDEPQRPHAPRKTSTKVHVLVQHFDRLANLEDSESSSSRSSKAEETNVSITDIHAPTDDDSEDFGLFEEFNPEDEEPNSKDRGEKSHLQAGNNELGAVEFSIDLSGFDNIYPKLHPGAVKLEPASLDVVLLDSFSTAAERKSWYRMSRYGSIRKHNNGGDDSYVRVNWAQSKVREETLKIVGEWMEEDYLSGRVVLGGSNKGSFTFGWNDKKSAPMPISQAFAENRARNKPLKDIRRAAVPSEPPKSITNDGSKSDADAPLEALTRHRTKGSLTSDEPQSTTKLSEAAIGWNSHTSDSQLFKLTKESTSPLPVSDNLAFVESKSLKPPIHVGTGAMPPRAISPVPTFEKLDPGPPALVSSSLFEEDWGEMVSSSVIGITAPSFSHTDGSRPEQSRIFEDMLVSAPLDSLPQIPCVPIEPISTPAIGAVTAEGLLTGSFGQINPSHGCDVIHTSYSSNASSNAELVKVNVAVDRLASSLDSKGLDPWASADFSIFETKSTAPSMAAPIEQERSALSTDVLRPRMPSIQSRQSREDIELDQVVKSVINNLPDLSYMLRK